MTSFTSNHDEILCRVVRETRDEYGWNSSICWREFMDLMSDEEIEHILPTTTLAQYKERIDLICPELLHIRHSNTDDVVVLPQKSRKRTIDEILKYELDEIKLDNLLVEVKQLIKKRKKEIKQLAVESITCTVCLEIIKDGAQVAPCGHAFCISCFGKLACRPLPLYTQRFQTCPNCKSDWDKPNHLAYVKGCPTALEIKIANLKAIENS